MIDERERDSPLSSHRRRTTMAFASERGTFRFPDGETALYVVEGGDSEGSHFFYHFGLTSNTVIICAACFSVVDVSGKNAAQVAATMYGHWQKAAAKEQPGPLHPIEKRPGEGAIKKELVQFLLEGATVPAKRRSVLIHQETFEKAIGKSVKQLSEIKREALNTCSECFIRLQTKTLKCCSPAIAIEIDCFGRHGSSRVAIAEGKVYERIVQQREEHRAKSELPPEHALRDTIVLTPYGGTPSTEATSETAPAPGSVPRFDPEAPPTPISRFARGFRVNVSDSGIKATPQSVVKSAPGMALSLTGDTPFLVANSKDREFIASTEFDQERLAALTDDSGKNLSSKLKKQAKVVLTQQEQAIRAVCQQNVPESEDERARLGLARYIDPKNGRHSLIVFLCTQFLDYISTKIIPECSPVLLATVGKAPQIATAGLIPGGEGSRDGLRTVQAFREFFAGKDSVQRRIKTLAQWIIMVINLRCNGAQILVSGIKSVEMQLKDGKTFKTKFIEEGHRCD